MVLSHCSSWTATGDRDDHLHLETDLTGKETTTQMSSISEKVKATDLVARPATVLIDH